MTLTELEGIKHKASAYLGKRHYKRLRPIPKIALKNVRRGHANDTVLTLPKWIFGRGKEYAMYYVIHEVVHYFFHGHTRDFKRAEVEVLKTFGIVPRYKKCYPRELLDLDGNKLYPMKGVKIDHFKEEIM